jgi:hypothetical protein
MGETCFFEEDVILSVVLRHECEGSPKGVEDGIVVYVCASNALESGRVPGELVSEMARVVCAGAESSS